MGGIDTINVVIVAVLIVLLYMLFRQRSRTKLRLDYVPKQGFAYLWNSKPLTGAEPEVLKNFPAIRALAADPANRKGVHLVRCGLFNRRPDPLAAEAFEEKLAIRFPDGAEILHAGFGDSVRTGMPEGEPDPVLEGTSVVLPRFPFAAHGTVIVNIVVRGAREPLAVEGAIAGIGRPERLM